MPFFPPGVALRGGWNSRYADSPGNENSQGVKDPVIDELVEMIIAANTYEEKAATCKAFDRYATVAVLLHRPTTRMRSHRIAYWDMFGRPETRPKYDVGFPTPGGSTARIRRPSGGSAGDDMEPCRLDSRSRIQHMSTAAC